VFAPTAPYIDYLLKLYCHSVSLGKLNKLNIMWIVPPSLYSKVRAIFVICLYILYNSPRKTEWKYTWNKWMMYRAVGAKTNSFYGKWNVWIVSPSLYSKARVILLFPVHFAIYRENVFSAPYSYIVHLLKVATLPLCFPWWILQKKHVDCLVVC